jgi:hypothetical protein
LPLGQLWDSSGRTNWFIVVEPNGDGGSSTWDKAFGPLSTSELAALEALEYAGQVGGLYLASQVFWPGDDGKLKLIGCCLAISIQTA